MKERIFALGMLVILLGIGFAHGVDSGSPGTYWHMSPDRAAVEVATGGTAIGGEYLPYTPGERYAFGTVKEQVSPDRVLAERLAAEAGYIDVYLPYTEFSEYAPWRLRGQVSPDRVLALRVASGMHVY